MNYDIRENHKFIVYCFEECPFCDDTFALLSDLQISYKKVILDMDGPVWAQLKVAYEYKTAPMIFRNHDEDLYEFIGGFDDLREYLDYYSDKIDEPAR